MRERQGERGKALERAGCSEFLRNINTELAAQKQGAEEREERGGIEGRKTKKEGRKGK